MHRKKIGEFLHDIHAIDVIKITEPFFCDASYNHIGKLSTLMVDCVMAEEIPAYPYVPYSSPYLLLPLPLPKPTTTPTPLLTYYSSGAWSEVTSMVMYVMMHDEFTDRRLPEYETYLHGYYLQVELAQITLIHRTLY